MKLRRLKSKATKYNSLARLIGLTTNCGLSAFYYGYCLTYFNSVPFRDIIKIYHLQNFPKAATQGLLTGCISFTGALGSILALILVDRFSRRKCLMGMSVLAIILSIIVMIPNVWILSAVRLIQGLVIGTISCITPLYINQMMPKSVSGPFWSYHQCLYVFGLTFGFIPSFIFSQFATVSSYWRLIFGFPIITSVIQIYCFIYVFPQQSPKFLVIHQEQDKARQTIQFLYKPKYVDRVLQQIIEAAQYQQQSESSESEDNIEAQQNTLQKPLTKSVQQNAVQLQQIIKKKPLKRNISLNEMLLNANLKKKKLMESHHSPNNKVALFVAYFLAVQQPFLGGPAVINYSGDLIEGVFPKLQAIFPIIINITGIFGALLSIGILARFGRRDIILMGTASSALCLLLVFFLTVSIDYRHPELTSHGIKMSLCLLFVLIRVILASTFSPVSDLYTAEIVQPNILIWCSLCQWIVMGAVTTFFPVIGNLNNDNPSYAFAIFGIYTAVSFFIDRIVLIQTKGKSQIDIRKEYDQKFPD